MATRTAAKNMLVRLGLSEDAANEITGVDGQNLSEIEDFAELNESKTRILFALLKNPGGVTAAGARNYGITVNMVGQLNFGSMCFYAMHVTKRLDRPLTSGDINRPHTKKAGAMREQEQNHSNPSTVPAYDEKNWPKTMEVLETLIGGYRAQDGSRMNYVVRQTLFPPLAVNDVAYGVPGSTYHSSDEEIIARHRIVDLSAPTTTIAAHEADGPFTDEYLFDRGKVYDIITNMFAGLQAALTIIKPHKKSRDGRGAYLALWNHYLGPNNVDHMAGAAEKVLANSVYKGQSSRYGIEQHIVVHKTAHGILESLTEYGYIGIDDRSKVRYLNDSIKTTKLDAPKSQIMSNNDLRSDFEACATLYKDFVAQSNINDHNTDRQVSALTGNFLKNTRYVPNEEWRAMSQEERDAELLARKNAQKERERAGGNDGGYKKKGGKGGGKVNPHYKKKNLTKIQKVAAKWSKAEVKAAKSAIKDMRADESDDDEEVDMKKGDGDSHGMRQKSKKGQK